MSDSHYRVRSIHDADWCWIGKEVVHTHAKTVGPLALSVYLALTAYVDGEQRCYPSQGLLGGILGYSRGSINRAVRKLTEAGLVRVERRRGSSCVYRLLQTGCRSGDTRVFPQGHKGVRPVHTNKNQRTRITDDDTEVKNRIKVEGEYRPRTKGELLAKDLAEGLGDRKGLGTYLSLVKQYPEEILRGILSEVKSTPIDQIKKSRGALFSYLVKHYASRSD